MDSYLAIKALHVIAAMALLGPSLLTPGWVRHGQDKTGAAMLAGLHRVTGAGGWVALLTGLILLALTDWTLLRQTWLAGSLVLFLAVQALDHFWADPAEERLAAGDSTVAPRLRQWLAAKVSIFILITVLMVLKP